MSNAINIETLTFNIIIENTNLNRLGDLFVSVIAIAITSFLYIHIVTSYLIKNMVLQYQIYLGLKFDFYKAGLPDKNTYSLYNVNNMYFKVYIE